jgi:ABC-2 type transport system permease protein
MSGALLVRSFRDSWLMLVSCGLLTTAFVCLRVWVASRLKFDAFVLLFSEGLQFISRMLPVSIEELASPLGRVGFSFEELPVVILMGLWTVARASDCLAGRIGAGTMEMLLAQPIRRVTLIVSHTAVTLLGVVVIALAAWLGVGLGLRISKFDAPPLWSQFAPAAINFAALGVFMACAATLASALARSRAQAVGIVIAIYVVELTLMIIARLAPDLKWLEWFTILSAYEPTVLTLGLVRSPADTWPLFWQYNGCLVGDLLPPRCAGAALGQLREKSI